MDKTLMDKKAGTYPTFSESPAFQPVLQWLKYGGKLLCVTSDDGHRPFGQFWDNIPASHRKNGQVLLSTAGGATLFAGDSEGEVIEVKSFFEEVKGGLPSPTESTKLATHMVRDFFLDAFDDRSMLKPLASYRRIAYEKILEKYPSKEKLEKVLTENNMLQRGTLLDRGSLIWRNQAGPVKNWVKFKDLEKNLNNAIFTNLFILGLPNSISPPYIEKYAKSFEQLGIEASAAPNSVCLSNANIDKGTVLRWMNDSDEFDFSYENCIAMGDNPEGNDYPLTTFRHVGMPFINCGEKPTAFDTYFLGQYEEGVAKFVQSLNDAIKMNNNNDSSGDDDNNNNNTAAVDDDTVDLESIFQEDYLKEALNFSSSKL